MDFDIKNLSAVDNDEYRAKIAKIDTILAAELSKPNLLVFPEGCCSKYLVQRAQAWAANWKITTICGTSLEPETAWVQATIVSPGRTFKFYKERLSPYDFELSEIRPIQGPVAGGLFSLPVRNQQGNWVDVNIGLLVCYDFRYAMQNEWVEDVQLIVVPMFDAKTDEPQQLAYDLAKRRYKRTLLVNKAYVSAVLPASRSSNWRLRAASWLSKHPGLRRFVARFSQVALSSSAHGPMSPSDKKWLASQRQLGTTGEKGTIWKAKNREWLVLGDYEMGIHITGGHDAADNAGYLYSALDFKPI